MSRAEHVAIVGSAAVAPADLLRLCGQADLLICADGGADLVAQAGLRPALVVGDMDSISPRTRASLEEAGIRMIAHPPEKDQTDLELAVEQALALGPGRITIAGALGGRLDHTLGNILLLSLPALRHIDARIVDPDAEALVVWAERSIVGQPGQYVSLLPLTPAVEGVATSGLRYPLHGERLLQGATRGVSNELVATQATIRVSDGCLLVVHQWQPR